MIDLVPDEEQTEIATVARDVLSSRDWSSPATFDRTALARIAEVGLVGLAVDEAVGGVGLGASEQALVFEAAGRELAPVALLGSVVAAHVLSATGADRSRLDAVLSGSVRVGLADPWDWAGSATDDIETALAKGLRALDAVDADLIVCCTPSTLAVVNAAGASVTALESFDPSVVVSDEAIASADVLAVTTDQSEIQRTSLLVAASLAGVAERALDLAVDYARQREAFGKPIGAFQAIKHRCADMATRCDAVTAAVRLAAIEFDAGTDASRSIHVARVVGSEAAVENAAAAIQIFGGVGFTTEAGIDRCLRRAQLLATLFGGVTWHVDRLLELTRTEVSGYPAGAR